MAFQNEEDYGSIQRTWKNQPTSHTQINHWKQTNVGRFKLSEEVADMSSQTAY